jgi:hypothetical protein
LAPELVLDATYWPPPDSSDGITWFQQIEQAEKAGKRNQGPRQTSTCSSRRRP